MVRIASTLIVLVSLQVTADIIIVNDTSSGDVAFSAAHQIYEFDAWKAGRIKRVNLNLSRIRTPALWDTEAGAGVTITGTLEQAEADLMIAVSNALPATVRERGKDVRQDARNSAAGAANANSVPALREAVKRNAELIELILEKLEQQKGR